ncbi:MAG TPA: hypothetical protein GX522_08950 [Firmicutes bacterium]|nr:hypothetical protein [Bacillota bacterium]
MLIVNINRQELRLASIFVCLLVVSIIALWGMPKDTEVIEVVALDEYLIYEGSYYQRTLTVVAVIDLKLIETTTFFEGRPLYKETQAKEPKRLLWPLDGDLYTVFVKLED